MRILLTNDDGIDAPGFRALYEAIKPLGEIAISAPDQQASATGHSISLNTPFKVQAGSWPGVEHAYRISSTPADCVRTAVLRLLPWKPDLVISGINQGANYGTLILYSGTVAAAAEAVILGIPAIAISLTSHTYKNFGTSAKFCAQLVKWVEKMGMEPGMLLNVNVPPIESHQIKGSALTHQGKFRHIDDLEPHSELAGHFSYILNSPSTPNEEHPDSDVAKVHEGYISVTPLHLDLTARQHWTPLSKWPWNDRGWVD
ncbi:MAG TPA: 5'/3'-nucleotidase SurE [bacterium]|jgi:5'-nucleotidase|nr:5'/3'-nucleotidase SurE [bacterium]